jgi:hypothetical protein
MATTYLSSTTSNAGVTSGITGTIAVSRGSTPGSLEWVDARFGAVMFPSVSVGKLTITPQGCPGQEVFVDGSGLTGTTSITLTSVNTSTPTQAINLSSFAISSDEEVDIWLPASGGLAPPAGTYTVTIEGEGFGPTVIPGQFQITPCSGN